MGAQQDQQKLYQSSQIAREEITKKRIINLNNLIEMKQIKTLLLIAILAVGFNTVQAQTKVAHISTDQLLSLMPETKALNAELEKLSKTYESELKAEEAKLQAKLKKYDAEAASQTDEVNQQRSVEVQQDQQKLYQSSQIAREEIRKKRNEKLKPILEK